MASTPPQTSFALQNAGERSLLITEAAARLGLAELILEKDFWVGWLLGRMFAMPGIAGHFLFKGGTSLSMVFGAVRRFSEDIDLAILPAALGFDESYFNEAPSASQRRKRMEELARASEAFVQKLQPLLEAEVTGELGSSPHGAGWFTYEIDANAGTPNLWFSYPSVTAQQSSYVAKRVKLEFGSLTNQQPSVQGMARTLISGVLPEGAFSDLMAPVLALDVARTFWEKATILHAEHHRPQQLDVRDRFARHYSDFAALWHQDTARTAGLARLDLLADVALHKSRYFGSAWANYDSAKPGSLKLVPPGFRWAAIEADHVKMRPMFLDEPVPFAVMIQQIEAAEKAINTL
jgi:hypothetical protein